MHDETPHQHAVTKRDPSLTLTGRTVSLERRLEEEPYIGPFVAQKPYPAAPVGLELDGGGTPGVADAPRRDLLRPARVGGQPVLIAAAVEGEDSRVWSGDGRLLAPAPEQTQQGDETADRCTCLSWKRARRHRQAIWTRVH